MHCIVLLRSATVILSLGYLILFTFHSIQLEHILRLLQCKQPYCSKDEFPNIDKVSVIPQLFQNADTPSSSPVDTNWLESKHDFIVGTYYTQWSAYERHHFLSDIPLDQINYIFYSFFGIHSSGKVRHIDTYSDIDLGLLDQLDQLKRSAKSLKTSMSIGGWGRQREFSKMVSNTNNLKTFVSSAIEKMNKHNFDGIDIDWEFPRGLHEFTQLVEVLRLLRYRLNLLERERQLIAGSLKLSMAVPCDKNQLDKFPISQLDNYLSFWNVMCYDFAGLWSNRVQYHSNLYAAEQDEELFSANLGIQYFLSRNVNSRKLVLGMPNYGRSFTNTNGLGDNFVGVGVGSYKEKGIWDYKFLPIQSTEEEFDPVAIAAYCYDDKSKTWISYDNEESAIHKAHYVIDNHLAGGMWWESSGVDYAEPNRSTVYNFVETLNSVY